jgi:hypothetical protein
MGSSPIVSTLLTSDDTPRDVAVSGIEGMPGLSMWAVRVTARTAHTGDVGPLS